MHCAETDVVRVFDEKLHFTEKEIFEYLKEADLEGYGFERTVEVSTETDENGKKTSKRTIYYKRTDDCSRVMFWESILDQRLPEKLRNSKITSTVVKEVKSRITGRKTKSCTVMVEIHPNRCLASAASGNSVSKRSKRAWCGLICFVCKGVVIAYDD